MLALSTRIPSAERLPAFSPACSIAASPSEDVLALYGEERREELPAVAFAQCGLLFCQALHGRHTKAVLPFSITQRQADPCAGP